jgi:hypothetical protein
MPNIDLYFLASWSEKAQLDCHAPRIFFAGRYYAVTLSKPNNTVRGPRPG